MKKLLTIGLVAGSLGLAGCSSDQISTFVSNSAKVTTALVQANDALIQLNVTILNDLQKQAALLAPYNCGAYALGAAILQNSSAASKVNAYFAKNVAAGVANVAVQSVCAAAGYPTSVTASAASAPAK